MTKTAYLHEIKTYTMRFPMGRRRVLDILAIAAWPEHTEKLRKVRDAQVGKLYAQGKVRLIMNWLESITYTFPA